MKICTVCHDTKMEDDFYKCSSAPEGLGYRCKSCDNKARRKYHEDNKERCKALSRSRSLQHRYGINQGQFDEILEHQNGVCKICSCTKDSSRVRGSFAVDHDHNTGEIRGLLCNQCNRAIGMLDDNPDLVLKAYQYLNKEEDWYEDS